MEIQRHEHQRSHEFIARLDQFTTAPEWKLFCPGDKFPEQRLEFKCHLAAHFVWAQVNSPRFVSAPFPVTIQAKNSTNGINTAFTGTVSLFSTNGIAVSPAVSSSFTNGTWSGNLVIAQTATNLVLWALDGYGEIGTANAINVVTRPGLAAAESGGNLYISWPINPSGFVLEVTTNLSSHNWFPVSTPPVQIGGQNLESISLSRTNSFYRLRFTGQ
jgi:hypothetical protein